MYPGGVSKGERLVGIGLGRSVLRATSDELGGAEHPLVQPAVLRASC
jgi:hypothetical protein